MLNEQLVNLRNQTIVVFFKNRTAVLLYAVESFYATFHFTGDIKKLLSKVVNKINILTPSTKKFLNMICFSPLAYE